MAHTVFNKKNLTNYFHKHIHLTVDNISISNPDEAVFLHSFGMKTPSFSFYPVRACSAAVMGFPVNADFVMMYWSFIAQVPFTLLGEAWPIWDLYSQLYLPLYKKPLEKSSLEIHCVSVSVCVADPCWGCYSSFTKPGALKTGDVGIKRKGHKKK